MILTRNSVLQYTLNGEDSEIKRIRIIWINENYTDAYVVKLEGEGSFPYPISISLLEEEIAGERMVRIPDLFVKVLDEEKISANLKIQREKNWEIIEFLWLNKELSILTSKLRSARITEASERFGIPVYSIKRLLKRFWQKGMTKNSLVLDYVNCGGKGKTRGVTNKKRGRPAFYHADQNLGINIDEDIQKIIKVSIETFYNKKNKPTIVIISMAL